MTASNDVFFALFSGGYTRYHLRGLTLTAVIVLIALDQLFQPAAQDGMGPNRYWPYWPARPTKSEGHGFKVSKSVRPDRMS